MEMLRKDMVIEREERSKNEVQVELLKTQISSNGELISMKDDEEVLVVQEPLYEEITPMQLKLLQQQQEQQQKQRNELREQNIQLLLQKQPLLQQENTTQQKLRKETDNELREQNIQLLLQKEQPLQPQQQQQQPLQPQQQQQIERPSIIDPSDDPDTSKSKLIKMLKPLKEDVRKVQETLEKHSNELMDRTYKLSRRVAQVEKVTRRSEGSTTGKGFTFCSISIWYIGIYFQREKIPNYNFTQFLVCSANTWKIL